LRELRVTIERENPPIVLGPLPTHELHRITTAALGGPPPAEVVRGLMSATAGLPFLVKAALRQTADEWAQRPLAGDTPAVAIAHAARFALIDRLRAVNEAVLDGLLITSLSPDLGAADVAAVMRISAPEAQRLVDSARGSGLVEPSHSQPFLRLVHRAVAQIVGPARHSDIEKALLTTQLEMSTLSTDLALRLAEHGVRDQRVADVLAAQALQAAGQTDRAVRLYRAAVDAGATQLTAPLADALALTGLRGFRRAGRRRPDRRVDCRPRRQLGTGRRAVPLARSAIGRGGQRGGRGGAARHRRRGRSPSIVQWTRQRSADHRRACRP
jgi:hypothetical protein